MDPSFQEEWFRIPGKEGQVRTSPVNGYCVSQFPVWSSLLISVESKKAFFHGLCAEVIGFMIEASGKLASSQAYKDFIDAWQRRRETPQRTGVVQPDHPYGSRLSTFCSLEQTLRALSVEAHDAAWAILEESGLDPGIALGDPQLAAGISKDTLGLLEDLSILLDRLDLDSSRGSRRLTRLLHSKNLHPIGVGRFVFQLNWILETAEAVGEASGLTVLKQIDRKNAVARLSQDYDLEEIASPYGIAAYSPSKEESNLLAPALAVRTKWHYQLSQSLAQMPRWSLKTMTGKQLARFFHAIFSPDIVYANDTVDLLRSRMVYAASFATGLEAKSIAKHLVIDTSTRLTIASRVEYRVKDRQFRIAGNRPELVVTEVDEASPQRIEDFICVPDRIGFHHLAEEWLRRHPGQRAHIVEPNPAEARNVDIDPGIDVTMRASGIRPAQIAQALPRAVFDLTGDLASIALWGDWEPVHSRTIRHYLTIDSEVIEMAIDDAQLGLIKRAKNCHGRSSDLMKWADEVPARHGSRKVGSPNFPERHHVQQLCSRFSDTLSRAPDGSPESWFSYSNAYNAYSAYFMTAALGYRAAIDPRQEFIEVGDTLIALFSDKDSQGFHRRVVPVPRQFVAHLRHLRAHRRLMATLIPLPERLDESILFWIESGRAKLFEPIRAEREAGDSWPFRINALRRRMRTLLFERGAHGLSADVWMGHWNLGACPWMQGSGYEIGELLELVGNHVEPILDEDGWTPIRSAMVDGLDWAA